MGFFDDLSLPVKFLAAVVVALGVLGAVGYMRRFRAVLGSRGSQPRLAVNYAASVYGSRRLVLVRRDNVEHLLLIGGPTDVVIEPSVTMPANNGSRKAGRDFGLTTAPR
jgi:flagellar protein FliO/FliZ